MHWNIHFSVQDWVKQRPDGRTSLCIFQSSGIIVILHGELLQYGFISVYIMLYENTMYKAIRRHWKEECRQNLRSGQVWHLKVEKELHGNLSTLIQDSSHILISVITGNNVYLKICNVCINNIHCRRTRLKEIN